MTTFKTRQPITKDETIESAIQEAERTRADAWVTDNTRGRGEGSLRLRVNKGGVCHWYFRYSDSQGRQVQIPITVGTYDEAKDGKEGRELAQKQAKEWSGYYKDGHRDLREYLEVKEAADKAADEAAKAADAATKAKDKAGSLRALCNQYVEYLGDKPSAKEVRNTFRLNIFEAYPDLADTPARNITSKNIGTILGRLTDAGKGNAARKLRAYLVAAYAAALAAQEEREESTLLAGFALDANPAALIPARKFKKLSRKGKRNLNDSELRVFLAHLKATPGLAATGVLLCLYTGGQRPTQLLRVSSTDYDPDRRTLLLIDPKGQRDEPRPHLVPLNSLALPIVQQLVESNGTKPVLFALRQVQLQPEKLSSVVTGISRQMVAEKTAVQGPFRLGDLRRTVETMMGELGISKDIKAQVLSHGIAGIQSQHYDMYEYLKEKRAALDIWAKKLQSLMEIEPEPAVEVLPDNVVAFKRV